MPAPLPKSSRDLILSLHQAGLKPEEIAAQVPCCLSTVYRIANGVSKGLSRSSWDALPPETQSEVRRLHARGYSHTWLSQNFDVAIVRLGKVLDKPPFHMQTGFARLEHVGQNAIQDYKDLGIGARELAKRYGVQERTMRYFLEANGSLKTRGSQPGGHNPQYKGGKEQEFGRERDTGKYWARQVAQSVLGQKLPKGYVIHHMNENPSDQALTNLWIFPNNSLHASYHQQQLKNLREGAILAPSHLAISNGGLWLPRIVAHLQESPSTGLQSLFDKQEKQEPAHTES